MRGRKIFVELEHRNREEAKSNPPERHSHLIYAKYSISSSRSRCVFHASSILVERQAEIRVMRVTGFVRDAVTIWYCTYHDYNSLQETHFRLRIFILPNTANGHLSNLYFYLDSIKSFSPALDQQPHDELQPLRVTDL